MPDQTTQEALAAARGQALHVDDHTDPEYGQYLVHCLPTAGPGCEWTLTDVERLISNAAHLEWTNHTTGHNLKVVADGKTHWFRLTRPHVVTAE